jgi:lipopolysaccharide export system protein LptA
MVLNESMANDSPEKEVKIESGLVNKKNNKNFSSTPTKIRSEKITITRKNQLIEFSDNVIVEKEDSSLLADKMIVVYEEKKSNDFNNKSTKIKKIEAFDHVKIFTDDSTATGDTGYFDLNENIFVLEKNVMVNNGTSIASGEKFIYNLTSKKGYFIGKQNQTNKQKDQDDRVTVIITDSVKDLKKTKTNHDQKNSQSK